MRNFLILGIFNFVLSLVLFIITKSLNSIFLLISGFVLISFRFLGSTLFGSWQAHIGSLAAEASEETRSTTTGVIGFRALRNLTWVVLSGCIV